MPDKRETPLSIPSLEGHHCTVDLRLEKLGMVPFFEDLSEEQLRQVNKKFTANHFAKGEVIYRQGNTSTMLRVVVAGNVKLVAHTLEGEGVLLDMLQPGDFFGNLTAGSKEVYNETAETQTDACILAIRLPDFREIMNRCPSVAMSVLDITTDRLNESRQRIQHLSTLPVTKRIAHILVTLGNKFGEENRYGLLIQLPLSRKDLADMAGTSTATTSRVMSQFQDDDLITSGRQWVAIKDKPELLRISAED
ncbi:cAMP-binding domain of CRP or a regulatory subunit of cAMP-dependent protein kinases [Fodinibius salinus]|uniref:cAMP-binding domain of CRP or a regulatory subunit of cAMP-dependent protein kinases n=1 Tax=Fodinibius salinus TaxID=860790 RepID=A0A5D3YL03_9BACT|nr:Crp/Fnr family transcriptional regulator [Fodinibius salinus]TYP94825.1 cAMP-binding domain of CRP or a regulatory subunit of cAMP-dependent protein kinases [Fodinibius salinus]